MKLLSQQIREIVQKSPMSSYAIAKASDIDKSAMSRFLNGGRLTMDKLDRLAKVLGLIVTPEVSSVPTLKMGRPSSKAKKRMMELQKEVELTQEEVNELAKRIAQKAFTELFADRRGVMSVDAVGLVAIYNNNPFALPELRQLELTRVGEMLEDIGISILSQGFAGDQLQDTDEKYSTALILDCDSERIGEVVEIVNACASETIGRNRNRSTKN